MRWGHQFPRLGRGQRKCFMSENSHAPHQVTVEVGGRPLILETGKIAKQANGAIVARYGDTVVLTSACMRVLLTYENFLRSPLTTAEISYLQEKLPAAFSSA